MSYVHSPTEITTTRPKSLTEVLHTSLGLIEAPTGCQKVVSRNGVRFPENEYLLLVSYIVRPKETQEGRYHHESLGHRELGLDVTWPGYSR